MTAFDNARSTLLAIAPADKTAALLTALDELLEAAYLAGKQVGAPGAPTCLNACDDARIEPQREVYRAAFDALRSAVAFASLDDFDIAGDDRVEEMYWAGKAEATETANKITF